MPVAVLPPDDPSVDRAALVARLEALEARVQAVPPRVLAAYPAAATPAPPALWRVETTGAAFAAVWRARSPRLPHPGLLARFAIVTGAGVTGEARVVVTTDGGATATSATLAIPQNYAQYDALGWQHGLDLWSGGNVTVEIQARRIGGATPIYTGESVTLAFIDPRGCTASGGTWYPGGWLPAW